MEIKQIRILGFIAAEKKKFTSIKGYEPNRLYMSNDNYDAFTNDGLENIEILGMNVVRSGVLDKSTAIMFNTKDFPEINAITL